MANDIDWNKKIEKNFLVDKSLVINEQKVLFLNFELRAGSE